MLHNFDRRAYISHKLNGPYRGLNLRSIAFKSFQPHWNLREASCLVDPQRLDNISTLLTLLMKVWHWFLNRPLLCFTVGPVMEALIQLLRLEATVFHCPNPTRYGRDSHSSLKQTKAAHNDQACHYGRLIWSGPKRCGFIFFYAHIDVCHSLTMHWKHACVCVCMCVPIQTNRSRLGQKAWSTARPLIAIYIVVESLISNSPIICCRPIPPLFDACVNVKAHQYHQTVDTHSGPIRVSPSPW